MRLLPVIASVLAISVLHAVPAAADASCSKFGSLRSKNANTPTKLTFVNQTPEMRVIEWINYQGGTQEYARLQPGDTWTVNTFLTHPWLVTDGPGNCYKIYLPKPGARTVTLKAYGWGGGD